MFRLGGNKLNHLIGFWLKTSCLLQKDLLGNGWWDFIFGYEFDVTLTHWWVSLDRRGFPREFLRFKVIIGRRGQYWEPDRKSRMRAWREIRIGEWARALSKISLQEISLWDMGWPMCKNKLGKTCFPGPRGLGPILNISACPTDQAVSLSVLSGSLCVSDLIINYHISYLWPICLHNFPLLFAPIICLVKISPLTTMSYIVISPYFCTCYLVSYCLTTSVFF